MATGNPVCDWNFFPPGTVVIAASSPTAANGSVTAGTVSGSGSQPKFVIYPEGYPIDPPYSSPLRQTSKKFSGLVPGNYVINGRSSDSCVRLLNVTINYVYAWTPRWRIQHSDDGNRNFDVRIDIEDSNFFGSVSYVTAQDVPDLINWVNESQDNVFEPVVGSELQINLIANTDGQFDDMTSCYDEKRFRATYYKKVSGVYVQKWQGFIIPQNGDEEYWRDIDIPVSITFSDGLADLNNSSFSDFYGNIPNTRISFLDGIKFCLYKTGLTLDIWETVNIYAIGMIYGASDSTLTQAYFDPKVYIQDDGTTEDSLTVLKSLLLNMGARLCQSDGVWNIDCPTLKTGLTTPTRKFDYTGNYKSNEDVSTRISLKGNSGSYPKIVFKNRSGRKSHQTMYGKLSFTYDYALEKDQSIVDGDFEDEDVNGGQLKNWQIQSNNTNVIASSVQKIKRDSDSGTISSNVLQIKFDPVGTSPYSTEPQATVYSREIPFKIDNVSSDPTSISFDVYVDTYSPDAIIFIDYALLFDDGAIVTPLNDIDLVDNQYSRVYLEPKKWQTITHDNQIVPSGTPKTGTIQVVFRVSGNLQYDYSSGAALQAVPTAGFSQDEVNRRKGIDNAKRVKYTSGSPAVTSILQFKLVTGDEVSDFYNVIQPSDQLGGGPHQYIWKLDKVLTLQSTAAGLNPIWIKKLQLDNVRLKYMPNGTKPDESTVKDLVMNANVKNPLEITFRHGDLPDNTNYQNLSHGWISLSNGTPTAKWKYRIGSSTVQYTLLELLSNIYQGQYGVDRWKLSGSVICADSVPFLGNTVQQPLTGKVYAIIAASIDSRVSSADIAMIECLQGTPAPDIPEEPPIPTNDYSPTDYSSTDYYVS